MNTLSCNEIDFTVDPVDFRKISTPSTTKAIIFNFDEIWPDECPHHATTYVSSVLSTVSDNITAYENKDATVSAFLDEIEDGKKWHYFIFYVFAHGGNKCFSLWNPETQKRKYVTSTSIWQRIGDAQKRFIGMFDNCYSGSQLSVQENEDGTLFASSLDNNLDIVTDLMRLFNKQDYLFGSVKSENPMFQLWASTHAGHVGYYEPGSSTTFSYALKQAFAKTDDNARYDELWNKVVEKGTVNKSLEDSNRSKAVPQMVEYGESFKNNFKLK